MNNIKRNFWKVTLDWHQNKRMHQLPVFLGPRHIILQTTKQKKIRC